MKEIVLASTSPYREELLKRLGLPFRPLAPICDEEGAEELPAMERAVHLALRKARSIAEKMPDALVIGADQIPEIDGDTLHKPGTTKRAKETLRRLSGRTHRLVTAVAVVDGESGKAESAVEVATLRMRKLAGEEIDRYVKREHVLNCAGAYRTEGLGITLFESIECSDPTGPIGLPLVRVTELLARFGVHVLR